MRQQRVYKLRDDLVIARRVFGDSVKYVVKDPLRLDYYTIDEFSFQLISLCDGRRDLAALSETAQSLFPESDLNALTLLSFYETYRKFHFFEDHWERNILLVERQRSSRMKRLKKAVANPLEIHLPAWNPDRFFGKIARPLGFLFTGRALVIYAALVIVAIWLSATHADDFVLSFRELWIIPGKTALGLVALWAMLLFTVVLHEIGHGLTCKRFGGGVYKIGFLLLYFSPCMYCDVTESYFFEDRRKKHAVTLAGGVVDLLTAAIATFVWYFTARDLFINQIAHRIAIFNGVTGLLVNYNPLMKYDGYFLLGDSLGVPNLRGDSFRFLGNRIRELLGLPHEEELITPRERRIYWIYGICALAYSVFVLWFVLRFLGGWLVHSLHAWGYVLTAALLLLMVKGYLRKLAGFVGFLYRDKAGHLRRYRAVYLGAGGLLLVGLFLLPFPRHVRGEFTFAAGAEAVVRAQQAGRIETVVAEEGDFVEAGTAAIRLRAETIELQLGRARGERIAAQAGRAGAQVARDPAQAAMEAARVDAGWALEKYYASCAAQLSPTTPIAGIILTPHLREKLGAVCEAGDTLYVVGDVETLRAEILLDERDLGLLDADCPVQLRTDARAGMVYHGKIELIAPLPAVKRARQMYRVVVRVPNLDGQLRPGMRGMARFAAGELPAFAQLLAGVARVLRIEFWI